MQKPPVKAEDKIEENKPFHASSKMIGGLSDRGEMSEVRAWQLLGELLGLVLLVLGVEDHGPAVEADLLGVDDVAQQRHRVLAARVARAPAQHARQVVACDHGTFRLLRFLTIPP